MPAHFEFSSLTVQHPDPFITHTPYNESTCLTSTVPIGQDKPAFRCSPSPSRPPSSPVFFSPSCLCPSIPPPPRHPLSPPISIASPPTFSPRHGLARHLGAPRAPVPAPPASHPVPDDNPPVALALASPPALTARLAGPRPRPHPRREAEAEFLGVHPSRRRARKAADALTGLFWRRHLRASVFQRDLLTHRLSLHVSFCRMSLRTGMSRASFWGRTKCRRCLLCSALWWVSDA